MSGSSRAAFCLVVVIGATAGLSCCALGQTGTITSYPLGMTFESIQEAIDASIDGSTIVLGPGSYRENLVIDKPLTLLGIGDVTILPESTDVPAICIQDAQGVAIRGVTIEDAATAFDVSRSSCSIVGCDVKAASIGLHIVAFGSDAVLVHQSSFIHPKAFGGGAGVLILGDGSLEISECTFKRLGTGVVLGGMTSGLIRGCSFVDCFDSLLLSDVAQSVLIANRFEGSFNVALRIGSTPQPSIGGLEGSIAFIDNVFVDSARWGIDLCSESEDGIRRLLFTGPIVGSGNVIDDGRYGSYGPYCPSDYPWPDGFFAGDEPADVASESNE